MVLREFFGASRCRPGWVSVRVLAWLCALASAVGAALMWLNVHGFASALGAAAPRGA